MVHTPCMHSSIFFNTRSHGTMIFVFFFLFLRPTLTLGNDNCDSALRKFLFPPEKPIELLTNSDGTSFFDGSDVLNRYFEFQRVDTRPETFEEIVYYYMESLKTELLGPEEEFWQPDIKVIVAKSWNSTHFNSIYAVYPYNEATIEIELECVLCNSFELTLSHELTHLLTVRRLYRKWPDFQGTRQLEPTLEKVLLAYSEIISDVIPIYDIKGTGDEMALAIFEETVLGAKIRLDEDYHRTMDDPRHKLRTLSTNHRSQEIFDFLMGKTSQFKGSHEVYEHILVAKARSHIWLRLQALTPRLSLKEVFDLLVDTTMLQMFDQSNHGPFLRSPYTEDLTLSIIKHINNSFIGTFEMLLADIIKKRQALAL